LLLIANCGILRARNVAGKLSFFANIVIADFTFARMARKAYCFCGLSDGVTVTQRPLEALFMVRIHVGQPIIRKNSSRRPPTQKTDAMQSNSFARPFHAFHPEVVTVWYHL
jgi:hypothetical protein